MRCKNCGWPNEDNVSRCVKCNAPLQGSMIDSARQQSAQSSSSDSEPLGATLREPTSSGGYSNHSEGNSNNCPQCGYPVSSEMRECPVCHTQLQQAGQNISPGQNRGREANPINRGGFRPGGGTINPWSTPSEDSFCTLRRIPWQNERVTYEPVSYSGEQIVLNRANTDSNNNSITSREQAIISHENGEWFIENRSDLQTTLVRVDRKLKLEDGDIIVLGNRMFEFRQG